VTAELIIAIVIWHEAQGESLAGKLGVCTVIYNRAAALEYTHASAYEASWRQALVAVVMRRGQFAPWRYISDSDTVTRPEPANPMEVRAWRVCQLAARSLVKGHFVPTENWNHFYNPALTTPEWAPLLTNTKMIDKHMFGNLE